MRRALTFSIRLFLRRSERPVRKVSSGTSSTICSWRCKEGQALSAFQGLGIPALPGGWRSPEQPEDLCAWLTLPSGVCFSLGLWTSRGWSSSLMVIPWVLLEKQHRHTGLEFRFGIGIFARSCRTPSPKPPPWAAKPPCSHCPTSDQRPAHSQGMIQQLLLTCSTPQR